MATVHNYACKYSQREKFLPWRKEIRIVFPSGSSEVFVQECNQHEHIENPDFIDKSLVFKWSHQATDIIFIYGNKKWSDTKSHTSKHER